ncbi:hypothetical protein DPMN_011945 [Dreissena polymorpha]|uniref:Uncharacterized protein n=1 Tax=Dreissena polymorpha TaxID=45954 RepID=A0A9D4S2D3_DREPO|nr:hypothetical protein DPMN_011945 [Dreissena polymorpha]
MVQWTRFPPSDREFVGSIQTQGVVFISSIDTKYCFYPGNGLDSVHICLSYSKKVGSKQR